MATAYCEAVLNMERSNVHKKYHDTEYGFPIKSDNRLFERLVLEINQAGLSWSTILNKKENFTRAYNGFNIEKVVAYNDDDVNRLLNNAGIIRNRLKIEAAIGNAKRIKIIQRDNGSFKKWLDQNHPLTKEEWVKLFKQTFKFTGGEIVNEFLMSTGYLPGAHSPACPMYEKVLKRIPAWSIKPSKTRL
jgi:DNA-3-methyladenine glycosylase I